MAPFNDRHSTHMQTDDSPTSGSINLVTSGALYSQKVIGSVSLASNSGNINGDATTHHAVTGMTEDVTPRNVNWHTSNADTFTVSRTGYYNVSFSIGVQAVLAFFTRAEARLLVDGVEQASVWIVEPYGAAVEYMNVETITGSKLLYLTANQTLSLSIQCNSTVFKLLGNQTHLSIHNVD